MPIIKEEIFFDDGSSIVTLDKTVTPLTLEQLVDRRNALQCEAEHVFRGDEMWSRLGMANRHIERVVGGIFKLDTVRQEIVDCLDRADKWFKSL